MRLSFRRYHFLLCFLPTPWKIVFCMHFLTTIAQSPHLATLVSPAMPLPPQRFQFLAAHLRSGKTNIRCQLPRCGKNRLKLLHRLLICIVLSACRHTRCMYISLAMPASLPLHHDTHVPAQYKKLKEAEETMKPTLQKLEKNAVVISWSCSVGAFSVILLDVLLGLCLHLRLRA